VRGKKTTDDTRIATACEKLSSLTYLSAAAIPQSALINLRPELPTTINYKSDCQSYLGSVCVCNSPVCFAGELVTDWSHWLLSLWANTRLIISKYLAEQLRRRPVRLVQRDAAIHSRRQTYCVANVNP